MININYIRNFYTQDENCFPYKDFYLNQLNYIRKTLAVDNVAIEYPVSKHSCSLELKRLGFKYNKKNKQIFCFVAVIYLLYDYSMIDINHVKNHVVNKEYSAPITNFCFAVNEYLHKVCNLKIVADTFEILPKRSCSIKLQSFYFKHAISGHLFENDNSQLCVAYAFQNNRIYKDCI